MTDELIAVNVYWWHALRTLLLLLMMAPQLPVCLGGRDSEGGQVFK